MGRRKRHRRRWYDWDDWDPFSAGALADAVPGCMFLQGKCHGALQGWRSPENGLQLKVCEGHAERMQMAEHGFQEDTSLVELHGTDREEVDGAQV